MARKKKVNLSEEDRKRAYTELLLACDKITDLFDLGAVVGTANGIVMNASIGKK